MTSDPIIAVSYNEQHQAPAAEKLANLLQVDLINLQQNQTVNYDYVLTLTRDYLGLKTLNDKQSKLFFIDFASNTLQYRCQQATRRKESLARAIGIPPAQQPHILDATAGLGRDSYILATLQYRITLLERSPYIHALLQDALQRAAHHPATQVIVERMRLIHADAITWLSQLDTSSYPDVIYLDPMFPLRKKSAAVKKEMFILQNLLREAGDNEQLLITSLACARKRVVVKRPRYAAPIAEHLPSFSIKGNSSRFDVYLINT